MKPAFKSARVNLSADSIAQDADVLINTIQLEQVLVNLLTNAIEAVKDQEDKSVWLSVELDRNGENILIHIDDNGPGIGQQTLHELCEPFLTTKKNGLGLGLSISQQILKGMNGHLTALNRDQGGARFSLSLPVISPNAEQSEG